MGTLKRVGKVVKQGVEMGLAGDVGIPINIQ